VIPLLRVDHVHYFCRVPQDISSVIRAIVPQKNSRRYPFPRKRLSCLAVDDHARGLVMIGQCCDSLPKLVALHVLVAFRKTSLISDFTK
jgi:hypothetical protein